MGRHQWQPPPGGGWNCGVPDCNIIWSDYTVHFRESADVHHLLGVSCGQDTEEIEHWKWLARMALARVDELERAAGETEQAS